ncbi:protein kinase [Moorena producens PAL-8-15-08-1]|uniref:non-specific serine/threonine protein kinase n=1 Tax=Moorena producens PAL-8-15-08-1 TaxID=1458985 RepID=A0A1D8TT74_9CYAN|nr:serine/threonine-protein kinase [Moorena producens]AOX00794.1 protein kinase [Moorena producens PAL-8-15-08-1]
MSKDLDFSPQGYEIKQELGQNHAGGRVTYLATQLETQQPVVIKQLQFSQLGTSWAEYDTYEREIKLLQQLNHPSIPRYIDSFDTPTGFCLVQEYKPAPSLAEDYHWTPEEVKQIAIAVLEVLVYLQRRQPPVIHRDIKPENILVDRQGNLKVYLVDFGFARIAGGDVTLSSVVKGSVGFMPPEQMFNRQLTKASDLYSLGITLICLLTGTKSSEINTLVDENYRINFKALLPKLNPQFIHWLHKMVAPNLKHRYPDAATALKALKPIDVVNDVTPLKTLLQAIQPTKAVVKLATLSLVAASSSAITYAWITSPARQLLTSGECQGCNLPNINLQDKNLNKAKLQGANLSGADLEGTNLWKANLKGANLSGANLEGANLNGALLHGANLGGANLKGANLDIKRAKRWRINLKGATMPDGSVHK